MAGGTGKETRDLQGARRHREETNVRELEASPRPGLRVSKAAAAVEPDPREKSYLALLPHLSEDLCGLLFPPGETQISPLGQPRPLGGPVPAPLSPLLSSCPSPQPDQITCSATLPSLHPLCSAFRAESVWEL